MKIAIIGAGVTGLTAGYYLSRKGYNVTIFEQDGFIGGLASGIKSEGWHIDRLFHHLFQSDKEIINLVKELGFEDKIWQWKDCGAPIFYQDKIYPFTNPLDLLRFNPLDFFNRIRTGLVSYYLLTQKNFLQFEKINATVWLKKWMGKQSFEVIWQPLMQKKFSNKWKEIAMTWMWARVHKRSRFLGYPIGGFQVIWDKMAKEIKKNGKIYLNKEIKNINEINGFDKIIFTCAPPIFLKIVSPVPEKYFNQLNKIEHLGCVIILLKLSKKILNQVYWLNINDKNIPFVVCVQHTNLINEDNYGGYHWAYLGGYFPHNDILFSTNNNKIVRNWTSYLTKFNKNFKISWIKNFYVFKEKYSQPLIKVGYEKIIPTIKTPINNIYLANMSQIYPWDRGINYAIELGKRTTRVLISDKE